MNHNETLPTSTRGFTAQSLEQAILIQTFTVKLPRHALVVDEATLELCLHKHREALQPRLSWTTPCGITVAIAVSFATCTFHSALGLPAATWQAIFFLAGLVSFIWTIVAGWQAYRAKPFEINDIIADLKNGSVGIPYQE